MRNEEIRTRHPVKVFLAVIGAIATGLGIFTGGYLVGHDILPPDSMPPNAGVRITELEFEGKSITDWWSNIVEVPREIAVVGTSGELPSGWKIWVCVLTPNMRYYPQREPIESKNGWRLDSVGIGLDRPDETGKQFSVCAVLANEDASQEFYEDATTYHLGLTSLPSGAIICDQVIVVRR